MKRCGESTVKRVFSAGPGSVLTPVYAQPGAVFDDIDNGGDSDMVMATSVGLMVRHSDGSRQY